jgi:hypothetical protein
MVWMERFLPENKYLRDLILIPILVSFINFAALKTESIFGSSADSVILVLGFIAGVAVLGDMASRYANANHRFICAKNERKRTNGIK